MWLHVFLLFICIDTNVCITWIQSSADIQFYCFMRSVTDLNKGQIYKVFDMLDVDRSGLLDFDEFYLLICILVAIRVGMCVCVCVVCACACVCVCVCVCVCACV